MVPRHPYEFSESYYAVHELLLEEAKHEHLVTLGLPVTQVAGHVF